MKGTTALPRLNRRTVIKTGGLLTAGGVGALLTTDRASAQAEVTLDTFDVPDAQLESHDGRPAGVYAFADARYRYAVGEIPETIETFLYLRDTAGGFHAIDSHTKAATAQSGDGTVSLGGDILSTDAYTAGDFQAPGPGLDTTVHVDMGVLCQVLNAAGEMMVDARASRIVRIKVTQSELTAAVGATGQIAFQEDTEDATPTPPA